VRRGDPLRDRSGGDVRGGAAAPVAVRRPWRGAGVRGCRLGRGALAGRSRSACADGDPAQGRADRHGLVGLDQDLHDRPSRRRRDLGVDLVGRDLDHALVALHRVAFPLQPLEDRSLGHRLAHLGHLELDDLLWGVGAVISRGGSVRGPPGLRGRSVALVLALRRRGGLRRAAIAGAGLPACGSGLDLSQDRAHGDGLIGLGHDPRQGARGGRGHLGVDLVGRDLDHALVTLDGVALLLQPFEDRSLGHRLAHLGHGDLDGGPSGHRLEQTL
jgi:hypothetical protein